MNSLNLSEIKAVAFDIDGTLYRTWKFNIRMPFHFFIHCFFFLKYGLVRNELRKKEISGNIQQIQAEMMAKRLKCSPEKAISELDRIVYSGLEKKFETIKPCKGVVNFIKKLKDKGYKIGILSDFPPEQKGEIWGIKKICDVVLGAEDAGALKPSVIPFNKLAEKLGIPSENILYVGNSHKYDVMGAKKAGMKAAWIQTPGFFKKRSSKIADISFFHYNQLEKIFFDSEE